MNAAFLVPRRADGGPRDALWAFTRKYWEAAFPDVPIIEGHDDGEGLFCRSAAMNRAREAAPDVDVFVILDADVLAHPKQATKAVRQAHRTGNLVIGYQSWCALSKKGTRLILAGHEINRHEYIQDRYEDSVSSLVAVPAALWDAVGGFDERFTGWGLEDSAFELACATMSGSERVPGELWHLWHPRNVSIDQNSYQRNKAWFTPYQKAAGNREAMKKVIADHLKARAVST